MKIRDVLEGNVEKVNIVGRVVSVREKEHKTETGRVVKYYNILLADDTGKIWFAWWRPRFEVQKGDVLKVINPLVRTYNNKVYLSSVGVTRVIKDPEDPRVEELPPLEELSTLSSAKEIKLKDIEDYENSYVQVIGTITKVYSAKTKEREDGAKMRYVVFGLDDSTGYTKVVAFDEFAEEFFDVDFDKIEKMDKDEYIDYMAEISANVSGKEVVVLGKVRVFDEIIGNDVKTRIFATEVRDVTIDDIHLNSESIHNGTIIDLTNSKKIVIGKVIKVNIDDYSALVDIGDKVIKLNIDMSDIPKRGDTVISSAIVTEEGDFYDKGTIKIEVPSNKIVPVFDELMAEINEVVDLVSSITEKIKEGV